MLKLAPSYWYIAERSAQCEDDECDFEVLAADAALRKSDVATTRARRHAQRTGHSVIVIERRYKIIQPAVE